MNLFKAFEDFHNEEQRKSRREAKAATNQIEADLEKHRNKQMTLDEALKKMDEAGNRVCSGSELFLNRLEALGLIKFEPEPELKTPIKVLTNYVVSTHDFKGEIRYSALTKNSAQSVISRLGDYGYRIIKDDTAKGSSK